MVLLEQDSTTVLWVAQLIFKAVGTDTLVDLQIRKVIRMPPVM